MRTASIAASLLLAVCVSAPVLVAPASAANDTPAAATAPAHSHKHVAQPTKPTWDQCFEMSTTRGFNHDIEEWQQSIQDCMAGKIPL